LSDCGVSKTSKPCTRPKRLPVSGREAEGGNMTSLSQYYEENLYPLQDGVLNVISQSATDFFLTGGTALSRAYYNHRYSDDLDFFVNNSSTFDEQIDTVFDALKAGGFFWNTEEAFIRSDNFVGCTVHRNGSAALQLDFVNDLVPHFGDIQQTALFNRVDSVRNIFSNKLSALFRYAAKDIADIREIFLRESFDLTSIIREARQKEAGLEIPLIGEIIMLMPEAEFNSIKWTRKENWQNFRADINKLVYELLNC
jgi:hypothetical protein